MKRHSGGGKPVQFQSPQKFRQQQEQNLFIVENFNQEPPRPNISSDSLSQNFLQNGKRKSSFQSLYHPRVKQHITEERITFSMQQLNLNNEQPPPNQQGNLIGNSSRGLDEGFVDCNNPINSDNEDEVDEGLVDEDEDFSSETFWKNTTTSSTPSFKINFAPGVKESLVRLDEQSFISRKIMEDIHRKSLALIPYKPTALVLAQSGNPDECTELVFNRNTTSNESLNAVKGEMDVDETSTVDENVNQR